MSFEGRLKKRRDSEKLIEDITHNINLKRFNYLPSNIKIKLLQNLNKLVESCILMNEILIGEANLKRILITGASGFLGQKLLLKLYKNGYQDINILTRNAEKTKKEIKYPVSVFEWDPKKDKIDSQAFEGVDIIYHLAGENVADGRWSEEKKKRILESRQLSSKLITREVNKLSTHPQKIISASAVGIYGDRGDELLDEGSEAGKGFLAEVCKQWESSFDEVPNSVQKHFLRIGIVLSKDGGAIPKMEIPFKAGLGGKLGDGSQYMSWIHVDDLIDQFHFLAKTSSTKKVFNGVAPNPVTNKEFTKAIGKALGRPTIFTVPKFVLTTALGEMSNILLAGQKVEPKAFMDEDFEFKFKTIDQALENLFFLDLRGERKLFKVQYVSHPKNEVFKFFSDEFNLEKITPPLLSFKVLGKSTQKIQEGTIIDYKLKIHGIPIKWKSLIKNFIKNETFTDQQLRGPYAKWVHQHDFISVGHGTLMTDDIVYKVPLGLIGRIFAGAFVKRDVNKIFEFRQQVIGDIFHE